MAFVTQLGLSLGLAGAAGLRAYLPLLVIGLLTRFSATLAYRPPFKILASIPVLLLLIALAAYELINERVSGSSVNQVLITGGMRIFSGAVVFAGLFGGLGTLGGLILGGAVAFFSHINMVRSRPSRKGSPNHPEGLLTGIEETAAIAGTLLAVLLPWSSYFIWGIVFFVLLRNLKENNSHRPNTKAKSWR